MKILIVHNDYGRYSGEEAVVDRMIADGRSFGYDIETLRRTSKFSRDNFWGRMRGFFAGIYCISARRMMREALRNFKPDIVHIHNLYPFISPAILPICRRHGIPVLMTVHNYRLICPTGLFLRDNRPCEECLHHGHELNCVRHNCENDMFRSLGYALRNYVARRTRAYLDCVNYVCCLTYFQKQKLVEAGFNSDKIFVFPNYANPAEPGSESSPDAGKYVGYVGRISPEKGFDLLLDVAKRHPEIRFRLAGAVRDELEVTVPDNVELCGHLPTTDMARFYCDARFVVIPSRCYEGFPMSLLEAAAYGKACVAPDHGAFPDLMLDQASHSTGGRLFKPLDVDDLERNIVELWNNPGECEQCGMTAKRNYDARFKKHDLNIRWDKFLRQVAANYKKI